MTVKKVLAWIVLCPFIAGLVVVFWLPLLILAVILGFVWACATLGEQ